MIKLNKDWFACNVGSDEQPRYRLLCRAACQYNSSGLYDPENRKALKFCILCLREAPAEVTTKAVLLGLKET